jgi:small subunit ribosomal protein S16
MLIIRYQRVGKRNHAQFKIVVAEKSSPVKGKSVEILGSYDPHNKEAVLKEDRIQYWLKIGAQCSDSAHNLLVSKGLIKAKKRKINIKQKPVEEEAETSKEDQAKPAEAETEKSESTEESTDKKSETEKETEKKEQEPTDDTKKVENK